MTILKKRYQMKRKITALSLGSALVLGHTAQAKFDGFYAGASVGYLNQSVHLKAQQNPGNVYADINNTNTERGKITNELFLGYGKIFKEHLYAGIEGKVDWAIQKNQKITEDVNFIYSSGRTNPAIAALLRFGYLLKSHAMIYGGVGAKIIRLKHDIFQKDKQISSPFSKRFVNLLTEIGIESPSNFLQSLRFRFSYSFMPNKDMKQKSKNFQENHIYKRYGILKTKTTEHIFRIGLVYQF